MPVIIPGKGYQGMKDSMDDCIDRGAKAFGLKQEAPVNPDKSPERKKKLRREGSKELRPADGSPGVKDK